MKKIKAIQSTAHPDWRFVSPKDWRRHIAIQNALIKEKKS